MNEKRFFQGYFTPLLSKRIKELLLIKEKYNYRTMKTRYLFCSSSVEKKIHGCGCKHISCDDCLYSNNLYNRNYKNRTKIFRRWLKKMMVVCFGEINIKTKTEKK